MAQVNRQKIIAAIRDGAMVRVTDKYGDVAIGVIVGGNARTVLINIGGDESKQALVEKSSIANIEVVEAIAAKV